MVEDELWGAWKRLARLFPVWRMPYEWMTAPSIWTMFGVDFLSGLRRNRSSRQAFDVLAPLGALELRQLRALAELNHRRQDAVSRWFAIGFVTLPASAALTLSQLAPQALQEVAAWDGFASWYLMLAYAAAVVGYYLMCAWRARQLLTIVEMHCIGRGVVAENGGDAGEDPLQEPIGA